MDHPTVLIISDDVEFSRSITARWQTEPNVPTFTMLSGDLWPRSIDNFEVAIVGPLRRELLSLILEPLHSTSQPLFCICGDAGTARLVRERWPRTSVLRHDENWLDGLILAASEAVQRATAEARTYAAEQACSVLERQAMLGRYMLDMRPSVNNTLTSVLGNADLLLLDPEPVSTACREQIETIHTMALRLSEIMQRFSSLATEMRAVEKESQPETQVTSGGLVSGVGKRRDCS